MTTTNTNHALAALLWSEATEDGTPLDSLGLPASDELTARISADWASFQAAAIAMGFDADEHLGQMLHSDNDGDAWNAAAHDFVLTRNHHGAGFWDGGWQQPWGEKLTTLAHQYGEINCFVDGDQIAAY